MESKVLIAYSSKYGATREIAEKVGETLGDAGINAEALPVEQVTNLTGYSAVILGSAVYVGQWRKDAVEFLKDNEAKLAALPVWFFSTGPTGTGDPSQLMKGWRFPEALQPIADRIHPRDVAFFHGVLDTKKLNFAEKLLVKGIKAPLGDFRDWAMITTWAASIADVLKVKA